MPVAGITPHSRARSFVVAFVAALVLVAGPVVAARAEEPVEDPIFGWTTQSVPLPASYAEYVPARDVLLVTVKADHPSLGNELVELNPKTGAIGRHVFVGFRPTQVATSDDGSLAYVAADGGQIVKVDLESFTVVGEISFPAPSDDRFPYLTASDLAVQPGNPNTIAAVLRSATYDNSGPIVAFVNGVALPQVTAYPDRVTHIEFANANTIYGYAGMYASAFGTYALGDQGLTKTSGATISNNNSGAAMELAAPYVVTTAGQLIDPDGPSLRTTFGSSGAVEATPNDDRVSFVSNSTFAQYKLSTGEFVVSRSFNEFSSVTALEATSAGFAAVGSNAVVLLGPDVVAGIVTLPVTAASTIGNLAMTYAPVSGTDIAFDSTRSLVYASVRSSAPSYPNSVVAIDPATGSIVKELFVGSDPIFLSLSDDSSALYVSLAGASYIVRIDTATFTEASRFPTGTINGSVVYPEDVAVRPGTNDTVAVTLRTRDYSPSHRGVALFTNGVRMPTITPQQDGPNRIAFDGPTTLYGITTESSSYDFHTMTVANNGVTRGTSRYGAFSGSVAEFDVADGYAWVSDGSMLSLPSGAKVASLGFGAIESAAGVNRIFQLSNSTLNEYEVGTLRKIATRSLGYGKNATGSLIQIGSGLAAPTTDGVLLMTQPVCDALEATITAVSDVATVGTDGDDVIYGTDGDDVIDGGGGDDVICSLGGNDTITGGGGNDTITGGAGDDTLTGGAGSDNLSGEYGRDTVVLESGDAPQVVDLDGVADDGLDGANDNVQPSIEVVVGSDGPDYLRAVFGAATLNGMGGNDVLIGGSASDRLDGGDGNDVVEGSKGADLLFGGAGDDELSGNIGNDTLEGGAGNDDIDAGPGDDTVRGDADRDQIIGASGADTLIGGDGDDTVDGGSEGDLIEGGLGSDTLNGGGNGDIIRGQQGNDTINGGDAFDRIFGGDGDDTIDAGAGPDNAYGDGGNDLVRGGLENDSLLGGDGNDTIKGDAGHDNLRGDSGSDVVEGGDDADYLGGDGGNDTLRGGNGNDSLHGGLGSDDMDGGDGRDSVTFGDAPLLIDLDNVADDGAAGENDNVRTTIENITGGRGNDRIIGSAGNELLDGGGGADVLFGGGGQDDLRGGDGNDRLHGGEGNDKLEGGLGNDDLDGGVGTDAVYTNWLYGTRFIDLDNVADDGIKNDPTYGNENDNVRSTNEIIFGGDGPDMIVGDANSQVIVGGAGADTLYGLGGKDSLNGGDGNDKVYGGGGDDKIIGGYGTDLCLGNDGQDTAAACETFTQ